MTVFRGRQIHRTDPLRDQPCDYCHKPLELGQVVIFDEDNGSHGTHEACHLHVLEDSGVHSR